MKLENKFIIPPFSVFDTKQGIWQKRKNEWLTIGIKSEIGRTATCLPIGFDEDKYGIKQKEGISIFDPVVCELCYKWFTPKNGSILDPFAGGSVRGIVAQQLGYKYLGIELSSEQVLANEQQKKQITNDDEKLQYINGDSNKILDTLQQEYDLIFSCPPYHDLEIYSNDVNDLSNMTYEDFLITYESIITKSLNKLKNNRFAIFVVGDIRDTNGFYKNFVEDTVKIFEKNKVKKYNEIILLKAIGTLPIRVSHTFPLYRKVGKNHENILVFYKGDIKQISYNFEKLNLNNYEQINIEDY